MLATTMETALLPTDTPSRCAAAVTRAAAVLAAGDPVALPTETVYGLATDALRPEAVVKIFEAKERPFFDPLIVHLPTAGWLDELTEIPRESRVLVAVLTERFWPGPLTLVLPRSAVVPDIVTAGLETVAVRMSAHPIFRAVQTRFGKPLAAPSANRFGRISPTTAEHVQTELGGRIPLIVDGGPTEHGLESTIVAVEGERLRLLRAGPITVPELAAVWREIGPDPEGLREGELRVFRTANSSNSEAQPEAPGQLASHYAPGTRLCLIDQATELTPGSGVRAGLLGWKKAKHDYRRFAQVEWLSEHEDLREAAAGLFAKLRRLDEAGLDVILAEKVPETGLGVAIMDRLRKAAHPK
ncbi:MAG: threonylcarbamoyl-AMP synthase [Chthoniobacter sp.]|nr:threonylcarbamoyl-AMP synthase [Chthoniobacter sp.]